MKLEAHRFVAGKLILKHTLPAFAPAWLHLWERTELVPSNFKFQVFTVPGVFFKLGAW